MVCEKCGKEFFEDWRKDPKTRKTPCRFCSRSCANSKVHSKETKEKIRKALKKEFIEDKNTYYCETCNKEFKEWRSEAYIKHIKTPPRFCSVLCSKRSSIKVAISSNIGKSSWNKGIEGKENLIKFSNYMIKESPDSILQVSSRTVSKILKRMEIPCSICGWLSKGVVGDIHHIKSRKDGGDNTMDNLCYICPNCHREIHSGKISENNLISLKEQIGEEWIEHYYIKGNVPDGGL